MTRRSKQRVLSAIGQLAEDPGSADLRTLKGRAESRLRVGDWRVIIELDVAARAIIIERTLPRGRAYDRLRAFRGTTLERAAGRHRTTVIQGGSLGPTRVGGAGPALAFDIPASPNLTDALATFQSRRSAPVGVAADDRLRPDPSVRCARLLELRTAKMHMQLVDLARPLASPASGDKRAAPGAGGRPFSRSF